MPKAPRSSRRRSLLRQVAPFANAVVADNRADMQRHVRVRAAFLNHFMFDPDVMTLLSACRTPAIDAYLREAAAHLDRRAREHGFASRAAWIETTRDGRALLEQLIDRAFQPSTVELLYEGFAGHVVKIGLPWPWLAQEMLSKFLMDCYAGLEGTPLAGVHIGVQVDAPPLTAVWQTGPQESREDARARLDALYEQAVDALAAEPVGSPGRAPKTDHYLERDAEWFYRVRVRKDPIERVRRECGKSRGAIAHGVKRAARLLALAPGQFTAPT